ncbi:cytochrome ubiquinol oxidase subunit I [Wohlfahrtiimonas larvae]|uniref:Cytochrome ubiquinol oxidase subunit I n=2 Tax=Wohlfahrtiimonas larvae TaxID=1157986 RepID=A0ABP9MYL3_9GAMM
MWLVLLEGLWLKTKKPVYMDLYNYWVKFFAIVFGIGVVTGVVMAFQFGTNWSEFSKFSGSVTGPLLVYEVVTAFFLEAGFLGIMLFGRNRVGPKMHFFATAMVALGTTFSAYWILVSNSFMQTPPSLESGAIEIVDGAVIVKDWLAILFSASLPVRLLHMITAALTTATLIICGTAAWHILRGNRNIAIKKMLSMSIVILFFVSIFQVVVGDFHGLNVKEHQPEKLAAIEGHWEPSKDGEGAPFILFAIPDQENEKNDFSIEIPHLASLVLTHSLTGDIDYLKKFPKENRPPVGLVFWSFRIMVALGFLMVIQGAWGMWQRRKKTLGQNHGLLRLAVVMGPAGLLAVLSGWFVTELGRQPWLVYHMMRVDEGYSFIHTTTDLTISLALFIVVYLVLLIFGVTYLVRILRQGPHSTMIESNA